MTHSRGLVLPLFVGALLLSTAPESAAEETSAAKSSDGVWTLRSPSDLEARSASRPGSRPRRFQAVTLQTQALAEILARAPMDFDDAALDEALDRTPGHAPDASAVLELPTPRGGFERFALVESPVMHPDLARWLDEQDWPMRTYRGHSLDRPGASVRLDWGRGGFHAFVLAPGGDSYFIDPEIIDVLSDARESYASFFWRDRRADAANEPFVCGVDDQAQPLQELVPSAEKAGPSTHGDLRTFRAAFAVTGDYTTQLAGGSAAQAQADVVTMVNRLNLMFERDLSLRLTLVADNHLLVYTDAASDPYTESSAWSMLSQNQTHVDAVIGFSEYDLGHVIFRGGLGLAAVSSACSFSKAQGVSGFWRAADESIVVDILAHEIGHQLSARHTFNSTNMYCTGNRTASSAYEPGSGSTIMSYSGSCGEDNIVFDTDDYFHGHSLDQILSYLAGGGSCGSVASAGNAHAPTVTAVGDGLTIPAATAFELSAASSGDLDGDALTFTWEQLDLGAATGIADGDPGAGPIIRSLPPGPSSTRLVTGAMFGETLPTTNRTLTLRVTARDNHVGGGRVGEDTVVLTSDTSVGPLVLTAPNGGEHVDAGSTLSVVWDVAGTDGGAVQATHVDILLSVDGGRSFPYELLVATPNDGSEEVELPLVSTAGARIMVRSSGNVFFDRSDSDFAIDAAIVCAQPELALGTVQNAEVSDEIVLTDGATITDLDLALDLSHEYISDLFVTLEHVESWRSVVVIDHPGTPNFFSTTPGCSGDDVRAILDDEAAAPAEDQCGTPTAIDGVFSPIQSLGAFDGRNLAGTWRLTVGTYYNTGGMLNEWCLKVQSPVVGRIFSDGFESGDTTRWSP